ncbi:MAG TPA: alpha/beta hydrolase, partial [Pirellulaceae bacterium]
TRIADQSEVGSFSGSNYRIVRNVTYATRGTRALKADLYLPTTLGIHPAIVTIHGGGWRAGTRAAQATEAAEFAARGYVVLNIDYRLAPADPWPAAIHDAKSAVYWLRRNAATHQIDPNQIGAYGYSAGGQLSLMLGLTDSSAGLEGPDATAGGLGSKIQAVAAGGPPTDFRDQPLNSQEYAYFLGGTRAQVPQAYQQASPAAWVSSQDAPTFMYVGAWDSTVNATKVARMHDLLRAAGVASELVVLPRQNHVAALWDPAAFLKAVRFLDTHLKSP